MLLYGEASSIPYEVHALHMFSFILWLPFLLPFFETGSPTRLSSRRNIQGGEKSVQRTERRTKAKAVLATFQVPAAWLTQSYIISIWIGQDL